MTIYSEAENAGTEEAYKEMYKKYENLSFAEAFSIIKDAIGILETKCMLGVDKAKLNPNELNVLINEGKELGKIAEAGEKVISARGRYNALVKDN